MKSYGWAPTFLLLTGYEQGRSVAAVLSGDREAARAVPLTLPETGACSLDRGAALAQGEARTVAGNAVEAAACYG